MRNVANNFQKSQNVELDQPWLSDKEVFWPVEFSHNVDGEVCSHEFFGLPIALWRGGDGIVRGALDICPHRYASLEGGKIDANNLITCPFHSWQFQASSGICVNIPHSEEKPRGRLNMVSVYESHGIVWIPMSQKIHESLTSRKFDEGSFNQDRLPLVPHELKETDLRYTNGFTFTYPFPWHLVIANFIDNVHGYSIHKIQFTIHRVRQMFNKIPGILSPPLTGTYIQTDDKETSVLVTFDRFSNNMLSYWKVVVPGIWLNKLLENLYVITLLIPNSRKQTVIKISYLTKSSMKNFLRAPFLKKTVDRLGKGILMEDWPLIEQQYNRIGGSHIPVGMAARYDMPLYRFYRYLERILGIQLDYSKSKVVTKNQ